MPVDRFTLLREMGYFGSLAEMESKYYQNATNLNTIGEQLDFALDASEARTYLGVTPGGGGAVTPEDIGLGNVDNTSDLNKPISTATQAALDLKANQTALDSTNASLSTLTTEVGTKLTAASPNSTGTATFVNLVVSGTTSFADGSIAQAEVEGLPALTTTVATVGNVVRLFGDVPRRVGGLPGGALLPVAPGTCVNWKTVNATNPPAAFDSNGDDWENIQL